MAITSAPAAAMSSANSSVAPVSVTPTISGLTTIGLGRFTTPVVSTDFGFLHLPSNDTIFGFEGNDLITINYGNDVVYAGGGFDIINDFGGGDDTIFGQEGNDQIILRGGNDDAHGGAGIDLVSFLYGKADAYINLQAGYALAEGYDTLAGFENADGSKYNDRMIGSSDANLLRGLVGDDAIYGGLGNDNLEGGQGNDVLVGGSGNDTLKGHLGNDVFQGGAGNDVVYDDKGADRYVFAPNDILNYDIINYFEHGIDKIDLRQIDARPDLAGNQAFTLMDSGRFCRRIPRRTVGRLEGTK